jgi:hypothetical protein
LVKSSCGWSPVWLHHKIGKKKTNPAMYPNAAVVVKCDESLKKRNWVPHKYNANCAIGCLEGKH